MRVKTRLWTALAPLLLAAPLAAGAQEAGKVNRVGVLSASTRAGAPWDVFEETLRERGWKARNIALEYRFAEGRLERLPELAADLVRLNVDVIVSGLGTTGVAHKATSRIPIVMLFGITEVEAGLVKSLARPGGNITGLTGDVTTEILANAALCALNVVLRR